MTAGCIPQDVRPACPVAIPDQAVRAKLLELLGLEGIPQRVEFEAGSEENTDEGLRVTRLQFANVLGESVPGVLVTPPAADGRLLAGVVCLPGTGGGAERLTHGRFHRPSADVGPLVGWARELARFRDAVTHTEGLSTEKGERGALGARSEVSGSIRSDADGRAR